MIRPSFLFALGPILLGPILLGPVLLGPVLLGLVLLGPCLTVPAPASAQEITEQTPDQTADQTAEEAAPGAPDTPLRPATVETDTAIREQIGDILNELEGYEGVEFTVRTGIVTLSGEIVEATDLARLEDLVGRIDGVAAVQAEVAETTDLGKRLNPAVARMQDRLRQTVAFLPLILVALAVAALVIFFGLWVSRLRQPWARLAPNAFIADLYRQIVFLGFVVVGLVLALDILNATALLGTILGAAGIIGLAIGFAVRDTVENFIASIMLSIRQPFHPNDLVEIDGDEGKVIRLTSRATILLSFDGNHIRIPNATVFKSRIVNFTRNAERRFRFDIAVESDSDLAAVRSLIEATVDSMPFTLERPGTSVWIEDITEAGVLFAVTGWIDQSTTSWRRARGETLRLVKLAIETGGYSVPDTTYRIRMDPPFATLIEGDGAPMSRSDPPAPAGTREVLGVQAGDDAALERMIAAERGDDDTPDLLRHDAPVE